MRYFLVWLSLLYVSCQEQKAAKIPIAPGKTTVINLGPGTSTKSLFQVIDTFWHVELELEDTNTLIKSIDKILVVNGTIYVMDRKFNSIKAFDYNGKYLYDVGGLGMAPGQYIRIMDIVLNKYTNTLFVLCSTPSKTLIEYSLKGDFIKSHNITNASTSVGIKNENNIYYFLNNAGESAYQNVSLVLCDSANNICGWLFNTPENIKQQIGFTGGIYTTGDSIYFNPPLAYTLYSLSSQGTATSAYTISFGDQELPGTFKSLNELLQNIHRHCYLGKSFVEQSEYIGFNYIAQGGICKQAFYNKKTGNLAQTNTKEPLDFLLINPVFNANDTMITATDKTRLKQWAEENQIKAKENIPYIYGKVLQKNNKNPILLFYKLKPF